MAANVYTILTFSIQNCENFFHKCLFLIGVVYLEFCVISIVFGPMAALMPAASCRAKSETATCAAQL